MKKLYYFIRGGYGNPSLLKRIINRLLELKARSSPYDAYYDIDHKLRWKRSIGTGETVSLSMQMWNDVNLTPSSL